jgi:hypothetical protein
MNTKKFTLVASLIFALISALGCAPTGEETEVADVAKSQ